MDQTTLTWKLVDDVAAVLDVEKPTRAKWRQDGRGVPAKWRIAITQYLLARGIPVAFSDFDKLESAPGRIAA